VTTQNGFLRRIAEKLRQADIPFMVTGSLSSAHYGEPRSTNVIDVVIDPTGQQLDRLVKSFAGDYYVSKQSALEALANRSISLERSVAFFRASSSSAFARCASSHCWIVVAPASNTRAMFA
jgi:hypothetical protein